MTLAIERPTDAIRMDAVLQIGELLHLAGHLAAHDRALVDAIYQQGMSVPAIARLMRCTPKVIRRRVRNIALLLKSPLFRFVVEHDEHWPPRRRNVARAVVCHRLTHRETAAVLGLTLHQVRSEIQHVNALCQEFAANREEYAASRDEYAANRETATVR